MLDKLWRGQGGYIAGYYGDNASIGLDPKWQDFASDEFVRASCKTPADGTEATAYSGGSGSVPTMCQRVLQKPLLTFVFRFWYPRTRTLLESKNG